MDTIIDYELDYYAILQVDRYAPIKKIQSAFRMRSREIHPDTNRDDPEAAKKFHKLSEALTILTNLQTRQLYDERWKDLLDEREKKAEDEKKKKFEEDELKKKKEKEIINRLNKEKLEKDRIEREAKIREEQLQKERVEQKRIELELQKKLEREKEEENRIEFENQQKLKDQILEATRLYAPSYLHAKLIGKRGENIKKIRDSYNSVSADFRDDYIYFTGLQFQIDFVKEELQSQINSLLDSYAQDELIVDKDVFKNLFKIVEKLRKTHNIMIRMPRCIGAPIIFEGTPTRVDKAKKEIIDFIDALKSGIEKTLIIPHRLHKYIIGKSGVEIKKMYTLFPKTRINFPEMNRKSDIVIITGDKNEISQLEIKLSSIVKNLEFEYNECKVTFLENEYLHIVDKNAGHIKKICSETNTRMQKIFSEFSIMIFGKQTHVCIAKGKLLGIKTNYADVLEYNMYISNDLHEEMNRFSRFGKLLKTCDKVSSKFLKNNLNISGPSKDVEIMKLKLINLEKKCSNSISCTENIYVNDSETINYIYANMNKFGSETKTRISYNKQNVDNKYFKIVGTDELVQTAIQLIHTKLDFFMSHSDFLMDFSTKYEAHFLADDKKVMAEINAFYKNLQVEFPVKHPNKIYISGLKEEVHSAISWIKRITKEIDDQVTVEIRLLKENFEVVFADKDAMLKQISDLGVKIVSPRGQGLFEITPFIVNFNLVGSQGNCMFVENFIMDEIPTSEDIHISDAQKKFIFIDISLLEIKSMLSELQIEIKIIASNMVNLQGKKVNITKAVTKFHEILNKLEKEYILTELIICKQFHLHCFNCITNIKKQYKLDIIIGCKRDNTGWSYQHFLEIQGYRTNVNQAITEINIQNKNYL